METQPATAIASTRTVIATIGISCFIYHRTLGPLLITLSFGAQCKSHNRALGSYSFTVTEPTAGSYTYRIEVSGRFETATDVWSFIDRSQTQLSVTVLDPSTGSGKTPTTLDVFSPQDHTLIVRATHQFTIIGWLTNDSAISGAAVTLQQWDGTKWATVKTTITDAQGRCSFTHSIATRGNYFVRMHNLGSNVNEASSSEFVEVTVI